MKPSQKDRFLQLLQAALAAAAPFRKGGMVSSVSLSVGALELAQTLQEDCIPEEINTAVTDFLAYCDAEFASQKGFNGRNPPRPEWVRTES